MKSLLQLLLQIPAYRRYVIRMGDTALYLQGKGFLHPSHRDEVEQLAEYVDKSPVRFCIDAGANRGEYSAALLDTFPEAEILAVEPSSHNTELLRTRFSSEPRLEVMEAALCRETGPVTLFSDQEGSSKASLSRRDLGALGIEFDREETVQGVRLDDVWKEQLNQRPIDVLKLDVEGHELAALEGSRNALQHTRLVQFEFGGCNIDSRTFFRDFWNLFAELDFELFCMTPFGLRPIPEYTESEEHFQTLNYQARKRHGGNG